MTNRLLPSCSTSLTTISERQIKTATRYHLSNVCYQKDRYNRFWKECRKREPLYTISGNVHWYINYGKWYEVFSKKLKIELSAISLLGIYLQEMKSLRWRNTCIPLFVATLFKTVKIWNNLNGIMRYTHRDTHTQWNIIHP